MGAIFRVFLLASLVTLIVGVPSNVCTNTKSRLIKIDRSCERFIKQQSNVKATCSKKKINFDFIRVSCEKIVSAKGKLLKDTKIENEPQLPQHVDKSAQDNVESAQEESEKSASVDTSDNSINTPEKPTASGETADPYFDTIVWQTVQKLSPGNFILTLKPKEVSVE